jgi:hypothetical protein
MLSLCFLRKLLVSFPVFLDKICQAPWGLGTSSVRGGLEPPRLTWGVPTGLGMWALPWDWVQKFVILCAWWALMSFIMIWDQPQHVRNGQLRQQVLKLSSCALS